MKCLSDILQMSKRSHEAVSCMDPVTNPSTSAKKLKMEGLKTRNPDNICDNPVPQENNTICDNHVPQEKDNTSVVPEYV